MVQQDEDVQIPVPELLGALLEKGLRPAPHGGPCRWCASTESWRRRGVPPPHRGLCRAWSTRSCRRSSGNGSSRARARHVVLAAGTIPVPGQRVPAARRRRSRVPVIRSRSRTWTISGSQRRDGSRPLPAWLRRRHRPDGLGEVDDAVMMVDIVNRERAGHIMTVEDPIEFLHRHKSCVVNQREVGADTHGFAQALKHVPRQDPRRDLVGEMRDLETIGTAITAAETGHPSSPRCTRRMRRRRSTASRCTRPTQQQVRVQLDHPPGRRGDAAARPHHGRPRSRRCGRGARVHPRRPQPDPRGQDPPDLLDGGGGRYGCRRWTCRSPSTSRRAGCPSIAFERCHDPESLQRAPGRFVHERSVGRLRQPRRLRVLLRGLRRHADGR